MVIEFKRPKAVPANNEDDDAFAKLDMLLTSGRMSSIRAIGCLFAMALSRLMGSIC